MALAVALTAVPAGAGEEASRRLARVLGGLAANADGADALREAGEIRSLIGPLEVRDRLRRREFAKVAKGSLPPKAAERFARTVEAYETGHGRLLILLRQLAEAPPGTPRGRAARGGDRRAWAREAREILARLEDAARRRPISGGELKVRAPELTPPALPVPRSETAAARGVAAGSEAVIGSVPGALQDVAAALAGPLEVYEWVRNSVRPEFYHGRMKGPLQAYLEQSGNDADTAAVLIDLLRAKGIPARFVRGTIEVTAKALADLTGTANADLAARVLARAGIPHEAVTGAAGIVSVRLERTWAEAYVPYANYRGTQLDAHGKFWIPLDAAYKRMAPPVGLDVVRDLGFDPRATLDAYLAGPQTATPLEYARARVTERLAEQRPGVTYESALNHRSFVGEGLGILPSSLPYAVVSVSEQTYDVPESLGHTIRFLAESEGSPMLDATLPVADLLGRRVTLSFAPLTDDDAAVAASYGGMSQTPPYLIEVRPILKSGGVVVASGTNGIGMGVAYGLTLELTTPGGVQRIENRLIAGNMVAIGLGGREVTADESGSSVAAQILAARAWSYLDRWNRSDAELAELFRVVAVRPTVSLCLVMSDREVEYAGGDPLYPLTFDWKGILIDADLRASAPVGVERLESERSFHLFSGLEGSILENRIFEDDLGIASVSTAKALGLAPGQSVEVHDLTAANVVDVLPGLSLDPAVKEEVRDAALRGLLARVPAADLVLNDWSGVGYLILDEATGEAAYQLQGGHSGGQTVLSPDQILQSIRDALEKQEENLPSSPVDADVAAVRIVSSSDFQEGTVNKALARPLRVVVTDDAGKPVPGATVIFSVISGGGSLLDPGTAKAGPVVAVAANERGEAAATLVLGKKTGDSPRYVKQEGDENFTQVGINQVSVRSGAANAADPFTAIAFPDYQYGLDPANPTVSTVYLRYKGLADYLGAALRFATFATLAVTDQYENPISNKRIRFAYRPLPEQVPADPGYRHMREPTDTPGHLLSPSDYDSCRLTTPVVHWGECLGESTEVFVSSNTVGVFAYVAAGDSPSSLYTFRTGTELNPEAGPSFSVETDGWLCPPPDSNSCNFDKPTEPLLSVGFRETAVNTLGNRVEAYRPGESAEVTLWADAVSEIERVENRNGRFVAVGTNRYRREKLFDSVFSLEADTPGTEVEPTDVPHVGNGFYRTEMTMALNPQLNILSGEGSHTPLVIPYRNSATGEVEPGAVSQTPGGEYVVERRPDPSRPYRGSLGIFSLWGADPAVTTLLPSPIQTSSTGAVTEPSILTYRVSPDEYRQLLAPRDTLLQIRDEKDRLVMTGRGNEGFFEVSPGLVLDPALRHSANLSVEGVSTQRVGGGSSNLLAASPFPIAACNLLRLDTRFLELRLTKDPLNGTTCQGDDERLVFELCRPAHVKITVDTQPSRILFEGDRPAGSSVIPVPQNYLGEDAFDHVSFRVDAIDLTDPTRTAREDGEINSQIDNRSVLPVGHTFVKGVDLADGHMVAQSTDLKLPGRHLGLEVTRTYASSGRLREGLLGAGWAFNYESSLSVSEECKTATVKTADGSSQVFTKVLGNYTPQRGYHTRLVETLGEGLDFFDKAGNRHRFTDGKVQYIEEPHGDRIVFAYGQGGGLLRVSEVHPEAGPVRALIPTYATVGFFPRIVSVRMVEIVQGEDRDLGLVARYEYDPKTGNLLKAAREGSDLPGQATADVPPRVESYEYSGVNDQRDPYQMVAAIDANGARTEYGYYTEADRLPGETATSTGASVVADRLEHVKEVREFSVRPADGSGPILSTQFSYDKRELLAGRLKTTVRDARGNSTLYVLNTGGSPLRIEEPLGKTTVMEWSTDIFKTKETDALGRVTEYGYDERANLTSERITTQDMGLVETRYLYEPRFNKLTFRRDAEGRETRYEIDPATGDLLSMTDAAGNRTRYVYDDRGRLLTTTDPRNKRTTHADHDSFGSPLTVTDALGNVTTREYDSRGRQTRQADTMQHESRTVYDGLDRPTEVRRVAGGASDDEATMTEYFPAGQPRVVMNANGAQTTYDLDGLNRVVATATDLGTEVLRSSTVYDGNGNKTRETDRRGVTRAFTYDALNRLEKVEIAAAPGGEGPLGEIARSTYDLAGNKTTETDLAGSTTQFVYDGLYRIKERVLPESGPAGSYRERFTYDKVGNRTSATDANGHTTRFEYDGLNRVTRTTNALEQAVTVTYLDPEGSKVNKSEERDLTRGLRTTFLHDALNRETSRVVRLEGAGSSGELYTTSTAYDDPAHAVTVTDPRGTDVRRVLDGLDHVVEEAVDPSGLNLVSRMAYDGLGNRKQLTDARSFLTRFEHDGLGRLVRTIDAKDGVTTARYDGEGLKVEETDRRGVTKTFTHDALGRPRKTTVMAEPEMSNLGWSQEVQYADRDLRRTDIDARNKATVTTLDRMGRTVRVKDPTNFLVRLTYDGVNRTEEQDKRGNATKYEYDPLNRVTKVTDPTPFNSQTVETTYDDAGNRRTEKDRRGTLRVTQMDPLGRVLTVTRGGTLQETNAYDGNGNKVRAVDGEAKETRFGFDRANRLEARTDGFGTPAVAISRFQYDANGNQTEEQDQRARDLDKPFSAQRTYDELNRLATVRDGEGNVTTYGYDAEGNRTLVKEPKGQETRYAYDELGKLLTVTQPAVAAGTPLTRYGYDASRNRIRQTDANSHVVTMGYDDLNRLTTVTQDPGGLGFVTTHGYDANGNEVELVDPKGQKVTNTYDELNRLKTKTYAFAVADPVRPWRHTTSMLYGYDPNGNLLTADESVASGTDPPDTTLVTTRTYDTLDRLETEAATLPDGGTRTVTYGYYANGTRKTLTDPSATVTQFTYDGQNRLQTATTAFGTAQAATTSYDYFPDDLLRTVTYPNGVIATHGYDLADRLASLVNTRGGTTVSSYTYGYDFNGNRLSQVETNGGTTETTSYGYDDLNRLERITYPVDGAFPQGRVVSYAYDLVGNRLRETERTTGDVILADKQGVFDNVNRLTTLSDLVTPASSTSFTWDANGNQRTKTTSGTTTEYRYDIRDKLVETVQGAATLGRFQYDFQGRRTKKIGEDGIRQYVYDQTSLLTEIDSAGLQVAKYDYGSDRLLSLTRTQGRRFFSLDGLRSVTNLTDDSGTVSASYHLDTWGNYRFPTELDAGGDAVAGKNRFGFTGYLFDKETGLYNAKARYFDPQLGRFLTQDSYLGEISNPPSLHRYFYANDNPLRYWDPSGHRSDPIQDSEAGRALNDALKTGIGFAEGVAERTVEAAPGTAITLARATQNLQKPKDRISGLEPIGEKDLAAAKETLKFYGDTLSNLDETGPAALDAIAELGPEASGKVIGGTTVDVIGTVEGTRALASGGVRAVRAAPGELGEVGGNLSGMFKGRRGPPTAGVAVEGATQLPPGARVPDSPPAVDLQPSRLRLTGEQAARARRQLIEEGRYRVAGGSQGADAPSSAPITDPARMLPEPSTARAAGDVAASPNAPRRLPTTRPIGKSASQNAQLQADIRQAIAEGATDFRVNQQQVTAAGARAGRNRPDLQYTRADGIRVYVEYDTPTSGRGVPHANRLLANDPNGVVITKTIK